MAMNDRTSVMDVLRDVLQVLEDEHFFHPSQEQKVVNFLHPTELQKTISYTLNDEGTTREEIKHLMSQIVHYSVKTSNPHFHNQLYGGVDEYGLGGAWLTEALNTSQYTFEVAPVSTIIEREVISKCLALIGYPELPLADGIMSPGGSISNMYGMVLARYTRFPESKRKGLSSIPPLACFVSEGGHYSISKGAHWLGIGTDNVYKVRTDSLGRMDVNALQQAIQQARNNGLVPFFVSATAGTTVLGAFDPFMEIAQVCKKEQIWFHIDACLGGMFLFSEKYRDRLTGMELSDSVSWNPHKILGVPLQCSLFLVKGQNALHEANCAGAKYLFQQDKFYDVSWDTGDKSVQCGRKVDAIKFWLMWKSRGTKGLREFVDTATDVADYFLNKIKAREGFRLVLPKFQGTNICFWYIPPSMRGQEETKEWWDKLYTIAPLIKERMILDGSLMIGYTPLGYKNIGNFFRMVISCRPTPTESGMDYTIAQIEKFGQDL